MKWKIPLSEVNIDKEEIEEVVKVLKSNWLSMGPVTEKFEHEFAKYLGVKYAFAVSSGTAALHVAYKVLNIKEGDEVIVPSLTFVATANAVLYTGAIPVFADITSFDDFNISPEDISRKITSKTKAVTVVHFGGYPCNMDAITEIAGRNNLKVIEDAAHALGAEYEGKKCGTIGDIGCFSFFPNKNMTTGEGGMIVTNRDDLAEKIKVIRSHGMTSLTWDRHRGHAYSYDVIALGFNYRIDEVRSAIGLTQLKKLDGNNTRRKNIVERYREELKEVKGVTIPFSNCRGKPSHHIFPILLNSNINRKSFIDKLKDKGVQTSIHYPPIHLFDYYRLRFRYKEGILPLTEEVTKREVTLPLYPAMGDRDIKWVARCVREVLS